MKLPDDAHTERPWRIHEIAPDFGLEDVWALPVAGGREDFRRLVYGVAGSDPSRGTPAAVRGLVRLREWLGQVFGWDRSDAGLGGRVVPLAERLPDDLRDAPAPDFASLPFQSLYLLDDEFAAEIANGTMHGVLHLGWVETPAGGYRGQMAVLVKPAGALGSAYMAAIRPFRRLVVYPALMRGMEREWARERSDSDPAPA